MSIFSAAAFWRSPGSRIEFTHMLTLLKDKSHQVKRYIPRGPDYQALLYKKFGPRYRLYRKRWEEASRGSVITAFPLHIDTDTIDSCNLSCKYCQEEHTRKRTRKKITPDLIRQVFAESARHDLCAVNIGSVGEPLLEKNSLLHILESAQKTSVMETFVHTNGLLLDKGISGKLIDSGLTFLCISVDASTAETYRKIRGADFIRLRNNIEGFMAVRKNKRKAFPLLRLSFLMVKENYSERKKILDAWGRLADIVDFQPLIDYSRKNPCAPAAAARCFSPFLRLMVGVTGDLGACCSGIAFNKDLILGNLKTTSIYEAWNGKKINILRKAMQDNKLGSFPTCLDCLSRRDQK